jgi:hypothetical protein
MIRRHRIHASLAIGVLAASLAAAPDDPPAYEPLPILKASDFLPPGWLKGPNFEVEDQVTTDGVFNSYRINSSWANYAPHCTSIALIRINEIGAIAQLKEVDKMAVAAGRDPSSIPVTVFGVAEETDAIRRYRDAGVARALFNLPAAKRDEVLPLLDRCAALIRAAA